MFVFSTTGSPVLLQVIALHTFTTVRTVIVVCRFCVIIHHIVYISDPSPALNAWTDFKASYTPTHTHKQREGCILSCVEHISYIFRQPFP